MLFKAKPFETVSRLRPIDGSGRVHWLCLAVVFLTGCAGAPVRQQIPLEPPTWHSASGGAYIAACRQGDSVTTLSHFSNEEWTLHEDRPPSLTKRLVAHPGDQGPFSIKACAASKDAQEITPERPFSTSIGGQRRFVVSTSGRSVVDGARYLDWRTVAAGLEGATFDGQSLWMVGARSLWHFNGETQTLSPKALPAEIGARSPIGVFRDGPALWIRTRDGHGWPVVVRGNYVHPLSAGGPLPPMSSELRFPVGRSLVTWAGAGTALHLHAPEGVNQTVDDVHALLPIADRYLLTGTATTVTFWDLESRPFKAVQTWQFGGATIAFFLEKETLYAVGRDYGVVTGTLRRPPSSN